MEASGEIADQYRLDAIQQLKYLRRITELLISNLEQPAISAPSLVASAIVIDQTVKKSGAAPIGFIDAISSQGSPRNPGVASYSGTSANDGRTDLRIDAWQGRL